MKLMLQTVQVVALLVAALPIAAQERPLNGAGTSGSTRVEASTQDTLQIDTARGPRLRMRSELLAGLPVDEGVSLLEFFPGFMRSSSGGVIYRTSNAFVGTYVDGVPVRSLTLGQHGLIPSLNSLSAVSLTGGGAPAARIGAAVVDYTTTTGGDAWSGNARVHSDAAAPAQWNQHLTRVQLDAAGPIPGVNGLRFSVAGHLLGQKYRQLPGSTTGQVYLASGVDTTITVTGSLGETDLVIPDYEVWDYDELPLGNSDRNDVTAAFTFRLGEGEYDLRYYRSSAQGVTRALDQLYNMEAWRGQEDVAQVVNLAVRQPLPFGLSGEAVLSHQRYDQTYGMLDPHWATTNSQPSFGITTGSLGFLADREDWPLTDPILIGLRSGLLPPNSLTFTTMDSNLLPMRQGVEGLSQPLRLNPYGMRTGFPIAGIGGFSEAAASWSTERRWYGRAALSREFGVHSVQLGGEVDRIRVESFTLPLAQGVPSGFRENPSWSAAFVQAGTSIQGIRVGAGVRLEHQGSDAMLPRVPGFIINLPDSLRGDAYALRAGSEPWEDRLERVVNCGGAATEAERTNSVTGAVVCKDNFVPAASHTVVSPRINVEYAGAGRFSARAAFGSYTQPRKLLGQVYTDLSSTSTSAFFPRDTDPVREDVAELGMHVRTMQDSWVDLQLFRHDVTNPVLYRRVSFQHPTNGANVFLNVALNGESQVTTGLELSVLQRMGPGSGMLASFGVSHTDDSMNDLPTPSDPLRAAGIMWLDLGLLGGPATVAHVLDELTLSMTASYTQGGRYTRLANVGDGFLAGRIHNGFGGNLAEAFLSSRLPSRKELDLRIAKGIRIGGTTARLVADLRNPLAIDNVHTIFAETGTTENSLYQEMHRREAVLSYVGTGTWQDMVIDEWPENELNRHMLRRAEQRYGNGDGIYTTTEMMLAVNSYLDLMQGRQWLVDSDRELRLGVEVSF